MHLDWDSKNSKKETWDFFLSPRSQIWIPGLKENNMIFSQKKHASQLLTITPLRMSSKTELMRLLELIRLMWNYLLNLGTISQWRNSPEELTRVGKATSLAPPLWSVQAHTAGPRQSGRCHLASGQVSKLAKCDIPPCPSLCSPDHRISGDQTDCHESASHLDVGLTLSASDQKSSSSCSALCALADPTRWLAFEGKNGNSN